MAETTPKDQKLAELQTEKEQLMSGGHELAVQLIDDEMKKVQETEGDEIIKSPKGFKFIDLTHDKPIRVSERVIVPVKDHPKFNFIGKILGPRGNSLKRMQTETGTKISILGKGSMRDKKRVSSEDDLRAGAEAKFSHLHEELHILVEAYSLPPDAHTRVGHALRELRKYLIPDNNDDIRQEQLRELAVINGTLDNPPSGRGGGPMRGRGGPGGPGRGGPGFRGGMSGPRGPSPTGRGGFGGSSRGGSSFGGPGGGRPKSESFGFEESYDQSYDQFFDSSSSYMDNSGTSGGDDGYYDSSYPSGGGSGGGGNDFGQGYGGDQSWGSGGGGGARFKSPASKPGPRAHPYSRY